MGTRGRGMVLTPNDFKLDCNCGRQHTVTIQKLVIEDGALYKLRDLMKDCGLGGKVAAVFDENTKQAVKDYGLVFDSEVILSPENLHANEVATAKVMRRLEQRPDVLVAVGAGTIHDVTRWCAHELGIPFVSCPTAASVDGFCSSVSAMTWHGFKKTMPGVAPELVVADTAVLAKAPIRLTRSGVGDMIGKYISLTDWKVGRILTGEYYCDALAKMTFDALLAVAESATRLSEGDTKAYEKLIYGLLLSGISMQLAGNSRPASGAEHHISHFIEMGTLVQSPALHGEKVGVGAGIASEVYHKLIKMNRNELGLRIEEYTGINKEMVETIFGGLADSIFEENQGDCLSGVTAETVLDRWDAICGIVEEVPSAERIRSILMSVNAVTTLREIGVSEEHLPVILRCSPLVRNRLTLMRVAGAFSLFDSLN